MIDTDPDHIPFFVILSNIFYQQGKILDAFKTTEDGLNKG